MSSTEVCIYFSIESSLTLSYECASLSIQPLICLGFRQVDVGKRCEAILFTVKLVEKHPLPFVVDTVLLRLANIFKITVDRYPFYLLLDLK